MARSVTEPPRKRESSMLIVISATKDENVSTLAGSGCLIVRTSQ